MSRPEQNGDDGFLSRWSRRKSGARHGAQVAGVTDETQPPVAEAAVPDDATSEWDELARLDKALQSGLAAADVDGNGIVDTEAIPGESPDATGETVQTDQVANLGPTTQEGVAAQTPTDAEPEIPLPPIESLTADSDYTPFMAPTVSAEIRKLALRKLFKAAVFGVRDGLDDYDEDFTSFEALGDTITADMRHHVERREKLARARALEQERLAAADEDELTEDIEGEEASDDPAEGGGETGDVASDAPVDEQYVDSAEASPETLADAGTAHTDQTAITNPDPTSPDATTHNPAAPAVSGKLRRIRDDPDSNQPA